MDKEQIIIDGVDVSGCLFYQSNFEEDYDVRIKHFCSNWHNSCESSNNSNCYFKQLARKTQECEELKERLRKLELENVTLQNRYQQIVGATTEAARYREALEKIEEYIKRDCGCECTYCLEQGDCKFQEILDIINKAKGDN